MEIKLFFYEIHFWLNRYVNKQNYRFGEEENFPQKISKFC